MLGRYCPDGSFLDASPRSYHHSCIHLHPFFQPSCRSKNSIGSCFLGTTNVLFGTGPFFPITNFVQNESGVGVYQVVNDHKLKDFTTQGDLSGGQILPRSFDLSTGLQRGGILMGVLSICALLYWTAGREMIRKLLLVFFLNGLILSILGIAVQVSGSSKMLWLFDSSNTHFFSTFHYHNNWGAFCILSLCSGLALSNYHLRRRHPEKSNNPWLFFLIMSIFLLATLPLARGRVSICAGIIILLAL